MATTISLPNFSSGRGTSSLLTARPNGDLLLLAPEDHIFLGPGDQCSFFPDFLSYKFPLSLSEAQPSSNFFFSVLPVCWPSIEFCPSAMLYDTFFSIPFNHHQLPLQVSPSSSCSEKRACFPGQVTPHNLFAEITHNSIEKIFFSCKDTSTLRTRSNQFFSCSDCH